MIEDYENIVKSVTDEALNTIIGGISQNNIGLTSKIAEVIKPNNEDILTNIICLSRFTTGNLERRLKANTDTRTKNLINMFKEADGEVNKMNVTIGNNIKKFKRVS